MRILLVTPKPPRSRTGNGVTADRWARILRRLGHRVAIRPGYDGNDGWDLLVALHAVRSLAAIEAFRERHPRRPRLVALTGTDLYRDLAASAPARRALAAADRLIVLQPAAAHSLPTELRPRARLIRQSARATGARVAKTRRWFDVCVVGHLRPVKDPFRAAAAARRLPPSSRLRVVHAGGALDADMERRARAEAAGNRRYRWLGNRPRWQVRRLLASSQVMVLSSRLEGGANVVSEALVAGLPVLSTRVAGSVGMLGEDYPGYFEVGDTAGLAGLLDRCETDPGFLRDLERRCADLAPLYHPDLERAAWRDLLDELAGA